MEEVKKVTPEVSKEEKKTLESFSGWTWWVLISFCVSIFLFGIINNYYENKNNNPKKKSTQTETTALKKNVVNEKPAFYTEYYTLKKSEVIRVTVPSGYSYTCAGGGKKYYHQAQNTKKPEIWGDGAYHKAGDHVSYFDLSYYDEEITIVCEFKKIN